MYVCTVRVLRAVRLLKKSKSLAPIVNALLASIMPVLNAFTLLGLVSAIYASMAVGLFGAQSPVLFGKLSSSMFTMFQVSCLPCSVLCGKGLFCAREISITVSLRSCQHLEHGTGHETRTVWNRYARAMAGRAA